MKKKPSEYIIKLKKLILENMKTFEQIKNSNDLNNARNLAKKGEKTIQDSINIDMRALSNSQ